MTTALLKPLSALTLAMALAAPAHASLTNQYAEGYGLYTKVGVLGKTITVTAQTEQADTTQGNPDSAGTSLAADASLHVKVPLIGTPKLDDLAVSSDTTGKVGVDLLYGTGAYDAKTVIGTGGVATAGTYVGSDNHVYDNVFDLGISTLIGLHVDTLNSVSMLSDYDDHVSIFGDSDILGLKFSVLGATVFDGDNLSDGDLYYQEGELKGQLKVNATKDLTALLGLSGVAMVKLVLNEQDNAKDCDATKGCVGIQTNALHLTITALNGLVASVNLILGHSEAKAGWSATPVPPSAVPLPGTWAMMLGGLGVLGTFARRRKQTA